MSKLSKNFIEATGSALEDETLQEIVGEKFPKFEMVVKAAIGINDPDILTKVILTLIPGLNIPGYMAVKHALDNPITKIMALRNTASEEDGTDDQ